MNKKVIIISAFALLLLAGAMVLPIGGTVHSAAQPQQKVQGMDLSSFSSARPNRPLRLLFIHHSVGGQLLADPGPEQNLADSIHATHPNGGGLRKVLEQQGYQVHEASYGSVVGEDTDLFDWLPKFQTKMDRILKVSFNDRLLSGDERNDIVVFKSCYPNNRFASEGQAPGNPAGPELTVWNAKATLTALLAEFQKHPNTLFMYVTAPPTASNYGADKAVKWLLKKVLGRPTAEVIARQAFLARDFNNWVKSPDGWLKGYGLNNVVVFDYYDVLTDHGESNLSRYPTGNGNDSHPARAGQQKAAAELVPFINSAVRRAGLAD